MTVAKIYDFVMVINEKCGTSCDAKGQITTEVSAKIIYVLITVCFFLSFFFFLLNFL